MMIALIQRSLLWNERFKIHAVTVREELQNEKIIDVINYTGEYGTYT